MRISQRSIEEVREASSIAEVASEFTALRRQGARFSGLCPYPDHQEKTPSFSISPDKGFYYCHGCLEANERVWTSKGLIPIAEAEPGDEVIGLDGNRETITDKWFKSGPTLRIKTGAAKEGIEVTPDHQCIFVKREEALRAIPRVHPRQSGGKKLRFSSRHSKKNANVRLSVEHASEVREGDFWLYPVVPDRDRSDPPLLGQHLIREYTKGPRNARITELPVNPRTAWLYGVWLAEGSLYRGGVRWSFALEEANSLAARVVETLEREFGRSSTSFLRPHKNICEVACSSTDLSTLFSHWFGRGCANKQVPVQALSWTKECQAALLQGYVDGDGYTYNGVTSAASVSEALAYGVFALCIQTGKVCSATVIPEQTRKDGVRRRKIHYVHILSKESLKGFFAEIDGINYFWSVVQEASLATEEPVTVVDITTTGSHTFLTKMGITHNCQRGGDAIKLVMDLKSLEFAEAVSYLADHSGVELQFEGGGDPDAARERSLRRRQIHRALAAATVYYHKYLLRSQTPEAQQARHYLRDRQIQASTIEEFRLGYAPPRGTSGFVSAAGRLDLDRRILDAAGLLSPRGGERFAGRITFPISDRRGRIVGFGARTLGDDQPKYLNSPETEIFNKRDLIYGFPQVSEAIRKERAALVVEGYTDVLMLYQSGIENAVATLGTATTPGHLRMLSGYADRIYVLFDPDAAGERAIERAAATAADLKLDLRVLRLPEDPADWLLEHSPEEFAGMLKDAVPVLEYGIRRIVARTMGADATQRSRAVPEVRSMIQEIKDPVLYREALRLATESLGVGPEVLRSTEQPSSSSSQAGGQDDPQTEAGGAVLTLILARPDLTAPLLQEGIKIPSLPEPLTLRTEDFRDETHARIFTLLREHAGRDLDAVLSDERARPLMDRIGALASQGERLYPSETSAREAWLRLAILSRELSKRETQDYDRKDVLQSEIQHLKQALRSSAAGA
ncbi:MAG: DNA primase [Actinomycetota bacterium]|nr:DNA primase [Actinomycetota bacterium]